MYTSMRVCTMCVCLRGHVFICQRFCVCFLYCTGECVYERLCTLVCACVCVRAWAHTYLCECVCAFMGASLLVRMCVCDFAKHPTHILIYIHTHTHTAIQFGSGRLFCLLGFRDAIAQFLHKAGETSGAQLVVVLLDLGGQTWCKTLRANAAGQQTSNPT